MRKALMYVLAVGALVLNPAFGCHPGPSFSYGLPEIEAALAGTWDATITRDGHTQHVKFRVEAATTKQQQYGSRGLIAPAAACGNRTLVKSAHACMDTTDVSLVLIALDGSTLEMTGHVMVPGTDFEVAMTTFHIGDEAVFATILPDGRVRDVDGSEKATAKLVHTK